MSELFRDRPKRKSGITYIIRGKTQLFVEIERIQKNLKISKALNLISKTVQKQR